MLDRIFSKGLDVTVTNVLEAAISDYYCLVFEAICSAVKSNTNGFINIKASNADRVIMNIKYQSFSQVMP